MTCVRGGCKDPFYNNAKLAILRKFGTGEIPAMKKSLNVAVCGATGAVGREMLKTLAERRFPCASITALASARSAGTRVPFGDDEITVKELTKDSFKGIDLAIFSAGGSVSTEFAPHAVAAGCVVVDNSAAWRMDERCPLVVPEVNPQALAEHNGIIANPNCTTIQMVVALQVIENLSHIKRVHVATYQAASGAGAAAMEELKLQHKQILEGKTVTVEKFPYQLAYNLIPQVDVFTDNGYTKEEMKMYNETRKIMHSNIQVSATCVRVPALRAHSESIWLETEKPLELEAVREAFISANGIIYMDQPDDKLYPMPYYLSGKDAVYVGRLRKDLTNDSGLTFWCVGDQIKKGAALNAVQIAEYLIKIKNIG